MANANVMREILDYPLESDSAAAWYLGQAGYVLRGCGVSLAIDPYLSDSAARGGAECARILPVPIRPQDLQVDILVITHDHLDHLDPETVGPYAHKDKTLFVAPRLACRKLLALGVPEKNIRRVDSGETLAAGGLQITGVYAVPTEPGVIDTTGYLLRFDNGRTFYHTADTAFSDLLLAAAPQAEVLACCINGKWGNLNVMDAARLAARVRPRFAIPNHYDVMAVNSENPLSFAFFAARIAPDVPVKILKVLEPFVWSAGK